MAYVLGNLNYFYRNGLLNEIIFVSKDNVTETETYSDFRSLMYSYLNTLDTDFFWKFATFCDDNSTSVVLGNIQECSRINKILTIKFKDNSTINLTFYNNDYCQYNLEYLNDLLHNYNTIVSNCSNYSIVLNADNYQLNTFSDFNTMLTNANFYPSISGRSTIIKFSNTSYNISGSGSINVYPNVDLFLPENCTLNLTNSANSKFFSLTSLGKTRVLGLGNFNSNNVSGITANNATGALFYVGSTVLTAKSEFLICFKDAKLLNTHFKFYAGGGTNFRGAYRIKARGITGENYGPLNDSDGNVDYQDNDIRYFNAGSCWFPSIWNSTINKPLYHTQRMCYGNIYSFNEDSGLTELSSYHISGLYESTNPFWINSVMGRQEYRKYLNCIIKLNNSAADWIDCFDYETYEIAGDVHLSCSAGPTDYISTSGAGNLVQRSSLSSISYSACKTTGDVEINNVNIQYVSCIGGIVN